MSTVVLAPERRPPPPQGVSDVIARCRAGDRAGWRDLPREYYPVAAAFLRHLGVGDGDAEDACQEVFVEVFRFLPRFEGRSHFKTWLYRICISQAGRIRRRRRVRSAFEWVLNERYGDHGALFAQGSDAEARVRLQAGLARMKPNSRLVFVLFELEGLSGAEIAGIVGSPVATVFRRVHEARRELQELLGETTRKGRT